MTPVGQLWGKWFRKRDPQEFFEEQCVRRDRLYIDISELRAHRHILIQHARNAGDVEQQQLVGSKKILSGKNIKYKVLSDP